VPGGWLCGVSFLGRGKRVLYTIFLHSECLSFCKDDNECIVNGVETSLGKRRKEKWSGSGNILI
jgi:hypothetical protein